MVQETYTPGGTQFGIGRVMGTSFKVLGRNFVPFIVLSAVCAIPNILFTLLNPDFQRVMSGDFHPTPAAAAFSGGRLIVTLIGWVVSILCYSLNQSALVFGTVQDLQGRRADFAAIVSRGFSALLPVVGVAILMTLGIMAGMLALIVPGMILLVMWWVTVPVIVVERTDISQAFGRSRLLTSGHRWGIFGLLILAGIIWEVVALLIGGVVGAVVGMSAGLASAFAAGIIAALILGIVFGAYFAVMSAVGYYYLRAEKEGIVIDDIARVFD
jgi:MFS family permease